MIKKKYIAMVVFLSIMLGSFIFLNRNQQITGFYNNEDIKINKIDIVNGNNGDISAIENKKIISDISKYLSSLKLKRVYFDVPSMKMVRKN